MSLSSTDCSVSVDIADIWSQLLHAARQRLSHHTYENWLFRVRCSDIQEERVVLATADAFSCDWLKEHYADFIRTTLAELLGRPIKLEWKIDEQWQHVHTNPVSTATANKEAPIESQSREASAAVRETISAPVPSIQHSSSAPVKRDLGKDEWYRFQANRRYVFEQFITGSTNQLAFSAAQLVIEHPGRHYNPLFFYGNTGLGKTHLLAAIGHKIKQRHPHLRLIYTTAEQFSNEVVSAVFHSKLPELHRKYRIACDVLLIDDIQMLSGKVRTQQEFFHIFNALYDSERQIVATSDVLPSQIQGIDVRLQTRFEWGLLADLQPPDLESRLAILNRKASEEGVFLPEDVAHMMAKQLGHNIRTLEGALIRVTAHASLTQRAICMSYVHEILGDILKPIYETQMCLWGIEDLQATVAAFYKQSLSELLGKKRSKDLAYARQVAMYLARKHLKQSFKAIGELFGGRDHSTVINACDKIEDLLKDPTSGTSLDIRSITEELSHIKAA
jgi:chromosomal replication initiator protein